MPHSYNERNKKKIKRYQKQIDKLQAKIERYIQERCPHTGSSKIDSKEINIASQNIHNIPPGTYSIKTCCLRCANLIQKSLNDRGKNSPYFDGMENGCIRLKIGPQATDGNQGEHAQKACPK